MTNKQQINAQAPLYVLGLLDDDERQNFEQMAAGDPSLAREVEHWREKLSPLLLSAPEVEAPAHLLARIHDEIAQLDMPNSNVTAFKRPIRKNPIAALWPGALGGSLVGAALAASLLLSILPLKMPMKPMWRENYIVVLNSDTQKRLWLVKVRPYGEKGGMMAISVEGGQDMPNQDYELWMIGDNGKPVSLGLLQDETSTALTLENQIGKHIVPGRVLAISLEPAGGSPTGQPTGPVVATGKTVSSKI